ncbi:MAG: helix-turn-helix domain-containing protein [Flavobacteriales bacterium]
MSDFLHIKTISELHKAFGYQKPNHPLITVIDLSDVEISDAFLHQKIGTPFYNITLKTKTALLFKYGREYFDFDEGFLFGLSPNQIIEIDETAKKGDMEGWSIYFHPDLIRPYALAEKITDYGFFSYETNEALHISDKEKEILNSIVSKIKEENNGHIDEFSQDVFVSNIELLLNYIKRFYSRQFITRKSQNTTVLSQFKKHIKHYFETESLISKGLPTVHYFAQKLNVSDSYLSDLLKKETGKNTQDHIHSFVIEKAKNRLINTDVTISEIAFELGFEYPQYFSRLFKNKTGVSPKMFRNRMN